MALSTANDGKRMTRKWATERAHALIHPSDFTAEELEWLEVTGITDGNDQNPDLYLIDVIPEDPLTERGKHYDIRKRPEVGD